MGGGEKVDHCGTNVFALSDRRRPVRRRLEESIPVVAHWCLSSLPRYLQPDEVERVIASCNPATPVGKRDRAILLLLARLGLRACDILQFRLDHLTLQPQASVLIRGKGRRERCLPLWRETATALRDGLD